MTLLPREGLIRDAADINRGLDWVMKSRLSGTNRMLALLAVASGMPLGCGPDGEPLTPDIGYRVHPALIYGGWVTPEKRNSIHQPANRIDIVLGVSPGYEPMAPAMERAHAVASGRHYLGESLPPVVVSVPRKLGQRHSRLLVGLLLDLVSRCAGHSIEAVLEEQARYPIFRHKIDQKDFRLMVGRHLAMNDGLDILEDLRHTHWSLPAQILTWNAGQRIEQKLDVSIPGLKSVPSREEGKDWRWAPIDGEAGADLNDFRISPFNENLGWCRNTMDIYWDARILGWCWSTAQFLATKKGIILFDLSRSILGESNPSLFRDGLLNTMTMVTRDQLQKGIDERHHHVRATGLLRDVYGTADGVWISRVARRAARRTQAGPDSPRGMVPAQMETSEELDRSGNGVTTSNFNEDKAGLTPPHPVGVKLVKVPENKTGSLPHVAGSLPHLVGSLPRLVGTLPGFGVDNLDKHHFNHTCELRAESPQNTTNDKEHEDEVVVDQGSPKNKTNHDPTTTGGLLVMKVKQEEEKEHLLGGWCLGFTPKDALGRPWSEAEVKTYFQAPTPGRTFPGPILEVLDGFGLSLSQLRTLQSQTCFTNTGVRAVIDAVNRGVARGRVLSGVGALYKILSSPPDPKTMCWVEDHWRIHRDAILAQAEAKKSVLKK